MTLTRLPDPRPTLWLTDYTQIMSSKDWYGLVDDPEMMAAFGLNYGNFWSWRPCRVFPHHWKHLGADPAQGGGMSPLFIRRCQRCGSQVCQDPSAIPPQRGKV